MPMADIPKTAEEYLKRVNQGRSLVTQAGDYLTSTDERIDVTNLLLMQLLGKQGVASGAGYSSDTTLLSALLTAINTLITSLGGKAVVAMPSKFISRTVTLDTEDTGYNLPKMTAIPNREIIVKAHKDNGGTLYVANDKLDAESDVASWPLIPNEAIGFLTTNLNNIWVRTDHAGDKVTYSMEVTD
jgi:hypothetical protein